jgi:uncharacterized protein (TIGR02145 family)
VTDEITNATTDFSGKIATVSVVPPPTASLTGSQSICPGGSANLTLSLTGTGSITVTLNDGTAVTFNSGATSGIIPVTPSSARTYTISSVTDIAGSGTSTGSATVSIYAPASITVQPVSSVTIIEGTTTTLSVTAVGEPTLNYQWYQDGSAISGANSSSYTTTNTTSAAGIYYVTVSTTCNVVSSTTSTVSVTARPPQGSLTGSTVNYGQTGQLTYTSSYGGGPFTIVYQPAGGSNVTVTNVTSGVAFNVASGTPSRTITYTIISVTDQSTTLSRTVGFTGGIATITNTSHYIGEAYGGGIVAYILQDGDPGYNASYQQGLIAATSDQSQSTGIQWYNDNYNPLPYIEDDPSTWDWVSTYARDSEIGTGLANTNKIIKIQGGIPTSYAAGLARAYIAGGYTDWYLPSKDELAKLYEMKLLGYGNFYGRFYWSSTEDNGGISTDAWFQDFTDDIEYSYGQWQYYKSTQFGVRAIRSFDSRPQGSLTGTTISDGQTGQLTYTSSNGTGNLFTIVYQPAGGSNVTVMNVTSGVAFNVASGTPTRTTTYTLVSVTDQTTNVSRTTGFATSTATINIIPQGSLTGNTIGEGQSGQLTYTSSNGGGPFTIVYLPSGGSNVTVNNISSTVAFNVVTPTSTTNYTLISVTDQNTTASRTSGFTTSTATITTLNGELVLYLDAASNASYPGTGTTWYDLSGKNNNISFSAAPTYSPSFGGIFTGMDGSNVVSSTLATTFSHNSFTIEWWINPSSATCCNNAISLNGVNWTDFASHMWYNNEMFVGSTTNNRFQTASNSVDVGAWQSYTYTFENGTSNATAKLYKNGVLINSASNWDNNSNTISSIQFGVGESNSIAGKMSSIRIYKKALTDSEVLQNYKAFESKFGLSSVAIGSQIWTNKNLDVTTYRNGDPIPQVTDPTAWAGLTTGAWCYYNNDPANGAIYGKLYNMYAVKDSRGLAPQGWHIPSDAEWTSLGILLGGDAAAGGKMKTTGITRWTTPNTSATNESGFTGLPGGYRYDNGTFDRIGNAGFWWSTTQYDANALYLRRLDYNSGNLIIDKNTYDMHGGFSVRLIKD